MGLTSILKHIGEIMLGDFKTTLVDRLSRVETKIDNLEKDVDDIRIEVKGLGHRTFRLEAVTQEVRSFLKKAKEPLNQPSLIGTGSP